MRIEFSNKKPEIYDDLVKKFGVDWDRGVVIAYGNTVHSKDPLPDDLIIHETTHCERQKEIGAGYWWNQYMSSASFRASEELLAYKAQYAFLKKTINDRENLHQRRLRLAGDMVSMYAGAFQSVSKCYNLIDTK